MEPDWAAEQLEVIRTVMERSAVYRRTLAPIMLFLGALGIAATCAGIMLHFNTMPQFGELWMGTAAVGLAGALLISRRQALKANEVFWSLPTRRVATAVTPPLLAGWIAGLVASFLGGGQMDHLVCLWVLLYGFALHAAGFSVLQGMRYFAWYYIIGGCLLITAFAGIPQAAVQNMHWFMGFFFGVLQFLYGLRLLFTERAANSV